MKVIMDISLNAYVTRNEGKALLNRIIDEGKENLFEAILEDLYPEGITENQIDDLLAYNEDDICNWLQIPTEEELKEKRDELINELEDLTEDYERVCGNIKALEDTIKNFPCTQNELDHYGKQLIDAQSEASDLWDEIDEIKDQLEEVAEELNRIRNY